MIDFWEELVEDAGMLMHKLLQQVELIDFYLNKVEFYFSKKQDDDAPAEDPQGANSDESDEEIKEMSSIQEDEAEDQDESKSPQRLEQKKGLGTLTSSIKKRRANAVYDVNQNSARRMSTGSGSISQRSHGN